MSVTSLDDPILNGPYGPPDRHFVIGPNGPTGEIREGRRPSESYIPVPTSRKGKKSEQQELDFDVTGERREQNTLINDIRRVVDTWRARGYPGVTPYSRKLLQHWAGALTEREDPMFFCQREAAETAIFLAEVAGRHGTPDFRARLAPLNDDHNGGLPRVALKMATGTGKTVVMAMLIAWQTINKVATPKDARFAKRFLVVTPGITIRDRLRVIRPSEDVNYYRERDLVPPDLWEALLQAQIVITNYHAFLTRDAKEIQGVAANTRRILTAGKKVDPFKETSDQMVARVLRDFGARDKGEIVVINDEAHHCYRDREVETPVGDDAESKAEAKERNEAARVWFRGLEGVRRKIGVKAVYDLSATPYYLRGSGYSEGFIFPWAVSDFSLMDAIESGIVKVPRIPVDDDAGDDRVVYLRLWDQIGARLPKKGGRKRAEAGDAEWVPPDALEGALHSLYRSYARAFDRYERELAELGEPPPVFIVVCSNTVVSKLMFDLIAGGEVLQPDGSVALRPGELPLLSNVEDGRWRARQRTVLIDSAQLESGETLSADFKKAASYEIEAFKAEYRLRNPGADIEKITDEDLLREVMNTVGKRGKLGEQVRCVVSVSMLTEGWDANTVTHILGIRRFGSQLLCEQVVGRGLRRRSYAVNDQGRFEAEYAEVYGVPFAFIPGDGGGPDPKPGTIPVVVQAVPERAHLRITFPKLDGYRVEVPDAEPHSQFDQHSRMRLDQARVALWTQTEGIVGTAGEQTFDEIRSARAQQVAYQITRTLLRRHFQVLDAVQRPWLFPRLVEIAREWVETCVDREATTPIGMLLLAEATNEAAEKIAKSIDWYEGSRTDILRPILRRFDPEGSTDSVSFATRKAVIEATRSHVSHVVLDGPKGNTWEERLAGFLEHHSKVAAFVKNDHLGFAIPYVHKGRSHDYVPDFLVRLLGDEGQPERTLIVEVSGGLKKHQDPTLTQAKSDTVRFQWCPAVNNHGGFGEWRYIEITDMDRARDDLDAIIGDMLAGGPVATLPG
jgi:type III restriction enzyme